MALWNAWDNIIIFHEWTKNGLPNPAFKEKVGNFSGKNQIKYAFKAICRYLLTSLLAVEDDASDSVSSINGNLPTMLSKQKTETFIITAFELFIHPFEGEIWILLHYNSGNVRVDELPFIVSKEVCNNNLHDWAARKLPRLNDRKSPNISNMG